MHFWGIFIKNFAKNLKNIFYLLIFSISKEKKNKKTRKFFARFRLTKTNKGKNYHRTGI